jgi:hypothetical protein
VKKLAVLGGKNLPRQQTHVTIYMKTQARLTVSFAHSIWVLAVASPGATAKFFAP